MLNLVASLFGVATVAATLVALSESPRAVGAEKAKDHQGEELREETEVRELRDSTKKREGVIYLQTDRATVAVETQDPHVQVVVEQAGELVKIKDRETNQQAAFDTGTSTLRLGDDVAGFEMAWPKGEPLVLRRGGKVIVTARRVDAREHVGTHPQHGERAAPAEDQQTQKQPPANQRLRLLREYQAVEENGIIRDVGIASDGQIILAVGEGPYDAQRPLRIWNAETNQEKRFRTELYISLAMSPSGKHVAVGAGRGRIDFLEIPDVEGLDVSDLELLRADVNVLPWPESLCFGPEGKQIVNVGGMIEEDWSVQIWDWAVPSKLHELALQHDSETVQMSPDGQRVLIGVKDHAPLLWQPGEAYPVGLNVPSGARPLTWTPDGRHVLVGLQGGPIAIVEVETRQVQRKIIGHTAQAHDARVLRDGKQLLSGGVDGTLRLWDFQSGKQLAMADVGRAGTMHIDVTADGRLAVTGGGERTREKQTEPLGNGDGKVRLWRLPETAPSEEDADG